VRFDGRDVTGWAPDDLFRAGLAHVPEDRQRDGLIGSFAVASNLVLNQIEERPFSRRLRIDRRAVRKHAEELVDQFDVRTASVQSAASTLSGGNQQKVIIARELSGDPRLLLVSQPTRGLDVGSIEFIHRRIVEMRDAGTAVLLVSAELDEIFTLADRIGVLFRGRLVGEFDRADATRETIGLLMASGHPDVDVAVAP